MIFPGDWSAVVPPLPIPNREVKRDSADDSDPETVCESRSLPGNFKKEGRLMISGESKGKS